MKSRVLPALLAMIAGINVLEGAVTLNDPVLGYECTKVTVSGTCDAAFTLKLSDRVNEKTQAVAAGDFSVTFDTEVGVDYGIYADDQLLDTIVTAPVSSGPWFKEDGTTVDQPAKSTGTWTTDYGMSVASSGDKIVISSALDADTTAKVAFAPPGIPATGVDVVRTRFKTAFAEPTDPSLLEGFKSSRYGVSMIDSDDGPRFAVLVGGAWVEVSGDIVEPEKGRVYEFAVVGCDNDGQKGVSYIAMDTVSGLRYVLARTTDASFAQPKQISFAGNGQLELFQGDLYTKSFIAADVELDGIAWDGTVKAGMNFTNVVLSGSVSLTNFCETSVNSGKVVIYLVDSHGNKVKIDEIAWNGFEDDVVFTNLVDSLTSGESYSVNVQVVADDESKSGYIEGDNDYFQSVVMARGLTNLWYFEDGTSTLDPSLRTGEWRFDEGMSISGSASGFTIVDAGLNSDSYAHYVPTNPVPANATVSRNCFRTAFASAVDFDLLPDASQELFGFTLATKDSKVFFAYVDNGVWRQAPTTAYQPLAETVYMVEIVTTLVPDYFPTVVYYITTPDDVLLRIADCDVSGDLSTPAPSEIGFHGEGTVAYASGELYDDTLVNCTLDVSNNASTNFTAASVSGNVTVTPLWDTDQTNCWLRIVVKDGSGNVAAEKLVQVSESGVIDFYVDGLEPGASYYVTTESAGEGHKVTTEIESGDSKVRTARHISGKWIDENASTFAGTDPGTGKWTYRTSPTVEAKVIDDDPDNLLIQVDTELTSSVIFEATNTTLEVVSSTLREISFELYAEVASFSLSAPKYAESRSADIAGVTICCDDLDGDVLHFAVYNPDDGGSWQVLHDTVAQLNRYYNFTVVITYPNPGLSSPTSVAYFVDDADGNREQIAIVKPTGGIKEITENYRNRVRFAGTGLVRTLVGECYDAHLATMGGAEYWTISDVIHEIGTSGRVFTPLWYSTYTADINSGWFGVKDPNHWLNLIWPLGYVVEITDQGDVRYYLFNLSDYWIDYADVSGVVQTMDGWQVKNANGLAWLARESTNSWLTGEITLSADITNLYEHIWTPIQGFTGTFDGNGKKIVGLTNKGVELSYTNELAMSAYGLFATASNSVFRNVAFEGVAVTNSADAVASLLGCSIRDLSLTNVIVRSGNIAGGGQYVAGIVGYIGDFTDVSVFKNFNAANIATVNAPLGGANAAGIANLGYDAGTPGGISVVSNENRGAFETTINSTVGGGNVAQVVAGGDPTAQFDPDALDITGNIGTGDVSNVTSLNHSGWSLGELPVVNLAAEVSRQSNDEDYKEFIEANDSTDTLIDPYRYLARMTGSFYQNGATNYAGVINDQITCTLPGETVTLQESCEIWSSVVIDRPITLDLDGKVIDNVFDTYTFNATNYTGTATVRNGTVTYPEGKLKTGDSDLTFSGVTQTPWNCNYWDRTAFVNGMFVAPASLPMLVQMLSDGATISMPEDSAYSIDTANGSINLCGNQALGLAALGYAFTDNGDGSYTVEIDDPITQPEISLALTPNGGTSKVTVKGARSDCEYCLQSVETLAESWDKATDEWISVENDGDDLEFTVDTSKASGFFRIKIQKK